MSWFVAAMNLTSTLIGLVPPTLKNSMSSMTFRSFACKDDVISAISSRKSVPVSAISKSPFFVVTAPVNAPRSWPKSSLARSSSVKIAQLIARKGLFALVPV
ncbi:hypothetical protein BMS3Bbin07_00192 [bacterium BMS3Bbin07]|nr:hypothetical protein BMS3Bbin07_00192 [bacterium BMS3Bbin07]